MSGLVNGLQNRLRRFDSARDLTSRADISLAYIRFFVHSVQIFK